MFTSLYNPWADATLLALQASLVMTLRTLALSCGGAAAQAESQRMVSEKITAHAVAACTLMAGGSLETVIAGYREVVEANVVRLTV